MSDDVNDKKRKAISNLSANDRYQYFIRRVCDFEVVWGLHNEGWACGMVAEGKVIPILPEPGFAADCAIGEWSGFCAKEICLDEFVKRWIPGANADGHLFAVFPTANQKAIVIATATLHADLLAEAHTYE